MFTETGRPKDGFVRVDTKNGTLIGSDLPCTRRLSVNLLERAMAVETEEVPCYLRWKSKVELILVDQESSRDARASDIRLIMYNLIS